MLFLKYMLLVTGVGMFVVAATVVANDVWLAFAYRRKLSLGAAALEPQPIRWRTTAALACLAWAPILIGLSLVVPSGVSHVRHQDPRVTLATLEPR